MTAEKIAVDLNALPSLYSLLVFVCCFRPLVRRTGSHTNAWFAGWMFLLAHYVRLLVPERQDSLEIVLETLSLWMVELCGLAFLWAASEARAHHVRRVFILELSLAVLAQALQSQWHVGPWLRVLTAALFLLPGVHLVSRRHRWTAFHHLAWVFALLGAAVALRGAADNGYLFYGFTLAAIFLSTAFMLQVSPSRLKRGVLLMTVGLVLWAITCPLQAAALLSPSQMLDRAVLEIPRYILAAGMILTFLDEYASRTEQMALHDPLTGLPNRRLFQYRLIEALEEARRTQQPVACFVIDVDKFKYINDNFGHPVGDGLLEALAKRLSWNLGPRDMLARTGGDEFSAVIADAGDEYHVRFIAGAMMAAGCVPVSIDKHSIDVHLSIGIAVTSKDQYDSGTLHKAADDAMYCAKRRGGGLVAFAGEEVPQIHVV